MKQINRIWLLTIFAVAALRSEEKKPQPGIKEAGVQRPIANIHPDAVFSIPGFPDWVLILPDSVWIGDKPKNTVTHIDPKTQDCSHYTGGEAALRRLGGWVWQRVGPQLRRQNSGARGYRNS